MKVTITDNVLDRNDWPIARLLFNARGGVTDQFLVKGGVYQLPNMVGWNLKDIHEWLMYDPTGNHPEMYNEVVI